MISLLVVVPTLNSYKLLPRLVDSLNNQTLDCWRVVFIDGGSNDDHKYWLDKLCNQDSRFQWFDQRATKEGIFGAMNQGFEMARSNDWVLFWGSDDFAASPNVFERVVLNLTSETKRGHALDLYVCSGRYVSLVETNLKTKRLDFKRRSRFLWRSTLRKSLFYGSTPPHQATLFGPGARSRIRSYNVNYRLAADLDYFLSLSQFTSIGVLIDKYDLVLMGDSGISAKEGKRRLYEVYLAYNQSFGSFWIVPFSLRYLQRLLSLLMFV